MSWKLKIFCSHFSILVVTINSLLFAAFCVALCMAQGALLTRLAALHLTWQPSQLRKWSGSAQVYASDHYCCCPEFWLLLSTVCIADFLPGVLVKYVPSPRILTLAHSLRRCAKWLIPVGKGPLIIGNLSDGGPILAQIEPRESGFQGFVKPWDT